MRRPRVAKTFGEGEIDKNALRRVIARQQFGVKRCYDRQLRKYPTLEGRIALEITISKNGRRASRVRILERSTYLGKASSRVLKRCIANVFRRARYPKVKGDSVGVPVVTVIIWLMRER